MDTFTLDKQKHFIEYLISESDLWLRASSIVKPEYFHVSLQKSVKFIKEFSDKFNGTPTIGQVKAETGLDLEKITQVKESDKDWFLKNLELFCKQRALETWVVKGPDLIEQGNYGKLEQGLKDALLISLYNDLGTSYYENPKERLTKLRDNNGQISTGWKDLDTKLYGGFSRGELHMFAGNSGAGKSLFLQNLAINFSKQNYNVVYISLELSEEFVAMRMDAMVTKMGTKDLFKSLDNVHDAVKISSRGAGDIWIKYMVQGSTVNNIKAYLKELEIQTGKRPDIVLVDYLDLLFPKDKRIDPSDLFIKDKFVSEELRGLANEGNGPDHKFLIVTASQFNRSGVEETEFNHSNIAGGKSKIDTADGVYGIYTSKVFRERGQYQLQMLKTRNSAATGERINLSYDPVTMLITDMTEEDIEVDDIYTQLEKRATKTVTKSENTVNSEKRNILSILDDFNDK